MVKLSVSHLSQADRAMTQGKEVYMLVHNSSLFPETIHRKKVRSLRPSGFFILFPIDSLLRLS